MNYQAYFDQIKKISPYSLATRSTRNNMIMPAKASYVAKLVKEWDNIPTEIKDQFKAENPDHFSKLEALVFKQNQKKAEKNISSKSVYDAIIQEFKDKAQPFIEEQHKKIDSDVRKAQKRITDEYNKISGEKDEDGNSLFDVKYGVAYAGYKGKMRYDTSRFFNSFLGSLINAKPNRISEAIAKAQEDYTKKEHQKIESLFFRLSKKYPDINQFKVESFHTGENGIEFHMTGSDSEGNEYSIVTNTIIAGGYNIQIAHYRWLMNVVDSKGKRVQIKS